MYRTGKKDWKVMGDHAMKNTGLRSRGFTLIASLMLLVLMTGLSLGLLMMVNTEQRAGSYDVENSLAYRGAEAGIESMTSSVAAQFKNMQAPTAAQIDALSATVVQPVIPGITFPAGGFNIISHKKADGVTLDTTTGPISGGPNAGLYATLIKVDLDITAQRNMGGQVHMLRTIEVALIPVFQFGIFSDSDLDFFAGPNFDFGGRIATNGNLYVADIGTLTLHDKISVVKEVYRQKLANGYLSSTDYPGPVMVPTAPLGCDGAQPNCRNLQLTEASKVAPGWTTNASWGGAAGISLGTYKGFIITGTTGAKALSLPFVQGTNQAFQIIRRPPLPVGTDDTAVQPSRLHFQAQIRVMLSDTALGNHTDGTAVDANDIQLDNVAPYAGGWTVPVGAGYAAGQSYFAHATTDCSKQTVAAPNTKYCDVNFVPNRLTPGATDWPLIGGWLRVEVKYADNTWHGVTNEWLSLGFARGLLPPNNAAGGSGNNPVHPNAILIFQQQADRNGDATLTNGRIGATSVYESTNITDLAVNPGNSQYNWFPINFYDTREGQVRDTDDGKCYANGVMNAVELDVYNLKRWLAGTTGIAGMTGTQVDKQVQNGYILYFSDRRGMLPDPNGITVGQGANNVLAGEYGFEDTLNAASAAGTPDGVNDPNNGEDVNGNNLPDDWGATNVGDGFGLNFTGTKNPYISIAGGCMTTFRKNQVTGARHVLRLVNGSGSNLPTNPLSAPSATQTPGGFTVASENPVYIIGDYNTTNGSWTSPNTHSAASVIADAVTLLSNSWGVWTGGLNGDYRSFTLPSTSGSRNATETWFRLAIAGGKNIIFPQPGGGWASRDYGTDGGMHNFLRYLEDWSGVPAHYQGSLVSLYYSQYATGIFKCCTTVYGAPDRKYSFDTLFLDPVNLPPGTPMFKDVNNLTYKQDFTPH